MQRIAPKAHSQKDLEDLEEWDIGINTAEIMEEMLQTSATSAPKSTPVAIKTSEPPSSLTTTSTIESKLSTLAERKKIEELIRELQTALSTQVNVLQELALHDQDYFGSYLQEHFGLSAKRSFELVTHLSGELAFVSRELLRPDPAPLPAYAKDEKAYHLLREQLSTNKPLQELVDNIWKLSTFLNIGKNIGPGLKTTSDSSDIQLSAVTLNGAFLPEYLFGLVQFNSFLRHNPERIRDALELFDDLMEKISPLDFIFLEEAWKNLLSEGPSRLLLKEEFIKRGYHVFGDEGDERFSMGGGLLGFSKHPIVDRSFSGFVKRRLGTETLAHKKVSAAKVLINNKYSVTLVTTHETSGDGIFKKDITILGTTSQLRGEEQQIIHNLIKEWGDEPLINHETGLPFPHLGTIFGGDTNKPNNEIYQLLSISTGDSYNNRQRGNIKYEGDFNNLIGILALLPKACWPLPKNFIDVKSPKTRREPGPKHLDKELETKAERENLATGSTYSVPDLKENKSTGKALTLQTTERSAIDMIVVKPQQRGVLKAFESYLINCINKKGQAITDHLMLFAVMIFSPSHLSASPRLPILADSIDLTTFGSPRGRKKVKDEITPSDCLEMNLGS